jgi:hypothetical protein
MWDASTDNIGVAGYKIYRNQVYLMSSPTTSVNDLNLIAGTQYCYQVSAYDSMGNESNLSSVVCATTKFLASPTNVAASQGTYAGLIVLSWDPVQNSDGFFIAQDFGGGSDSYLINGQGYNDFHGTTLSISASTGYTYCFNRPLKKAVG